MRKVQLFFIACSLFFLTGCPLNKQSQISKTLTVVSWNLQNMFNAVKDGNEYDEYLPSHGWNEGAYKQRLSCLSTVLNYEVMKDADIFVFNEVENESTVEDIIRAANLQKRGFLYYATAGEKGGAIKTAVVSKLPIVDVRIHSIDGVRPILQVELQNLGERLFILAVHAKSNLEGIRETAPKRLEQAEIISNIARDIEAENPDALVIVAGDLNETFEDKNMMCDFRLSSSCPLLLLPEFQDKTWYCPWLDSENDFPVYGSYMYQNEWRCYDNILISKAGGDNKGWEFSEAGVIFHGILQTTDNRPNTFRRELLSGVSDHLPVWVRFKLI